MTVVEALGRTYEIPRDNLHAHTVDGDMRLMLRWHLEGTLNVVAEQDGHRLVAKYGKHFDYTRRYGLVFLGTFRNDREAEAVWRGWLRAGAIA